MRHPAVKEPIQNADNPCPVRHRVGSTYHAAFLAVMLVAAGSLSAAKSSAVSAEAAVPGKVAVSNKAVPLPEGRMIKPREVLKAEEALTLIDLSQLLRSGLSDREIIEDVRRRGLVEALNESGERYLQAYRASPALITTLRNYDYVLTDVERQNYYARSSARLENSPGTAGRQHSGGADDRERKRQLDLQRQTIAIAERNQQMEANRVAKMDEETAEDRRQRVLTNDRSSQTTALRSITSGTIYGTPGYVRPYPRYPAPNYPAPNYPRRVLPVERQSSFSKQP
ncbi:MAG: hypothetical protein JWL59_243 [Chthoniobacteraceae bacterium]|nr:hypothetical protein [Chthoniobacteraceae bacterium]